MPHPHNPKEKDLTPGRISTVFFFPVNSYDVLKDKADKWGKTTNYGRSGNMDSFFISEAVLKMSKEEGGSGATVSEPKKEFKGKRRVGRS